MTLQNTSSYILVGTGNGDAASVRREKVLGLRWVQFPPGNWVAPAGSYRSGGGGNKTVGAFETDVSLSAMQRADRP